MPKRSGCERRRRACRCCPALGESAGSGLRPAARCWPRSCAARRQDAMPAARFPRTGSREPGAGRLRRRSGPAALRAEGLQPWAPSSRASLLPLLARGGEGREGTRGGSAPAPLSLPRKPARLPLALLFPEPLPAPVARSQTRERKNERGGGGAADSAPSRPSCGKAAALLLAERGCESGVGRRPAAPRGRTRRARSGGAAASPPGEAREEGPRGAHDLRAGDRCSFAHLRALPAF